LDLNLDLDLDLGFDVDLDWRPSNSRNRGEPADSFSAFNRLSKMCRA
jgi:hypothetical protein